MAADSLKKKTQNKNHPRKVQNFEGNRQGTSCASVTNNSNTPKQTLSQKIYEDLCNYGIKFFNDDKTKNAPVTT